MRIPNLDDERRFHIFAEKLRNGFKPSDKQTEYMLDLFYAFFYSWCAVRNYDRKQSARIVESSSVIAEYLEGTKNERP